MLKLKSKKCKGNQFRSKNIFEKLSLEEKALWLKPVKGSKYNPVITYQTKKIRVQSQTNYNRSRDKDSEKSAVQPRTTGVMHTACTSSRQEIPSQHHGGKHQQMDDRRKNQRRK